MKLEITEKELGKIMADKLGLEMSEECRKEELRIREEIEELREMVRKKFEEEKKWEQIVKGISKQKEVMENRVGVHETREKQIKAQLERWKAMIYFTAMFVVIDKIRSNELLKTEWIRRVEELVPVEETGEWRTKVPMEQREKYFRKWSKEERKWVHSKDAYNW